MHERREVASPRRILASTPRSADKAKLDAALRLCQWKTTVQPSPGNVAEAVKQISEAEDCLLRCEFGDSQRARYARKIGHYKVAHIRAHTHTLLALNFAACRNAFSRFAPG